MKKYLIVGLGNIGQEYTNTRHNIGFEILDSFAAKVNISFSNAKFGSVSEYKFKGRSFIFLKPNTYMNLSGSAVTHWLKSEKIPLTNLLIISDDLNLPFAKLRLKPSGSNGGHNGLLSIDETIGKNYKRLRIGIGHPGRKEMVSSYVLEKFSGTERKIINNKIALIKKYFSLVFEDDSLFLTKITL